jgi:uncharacterized membrane protein YiaA
VAGHNGTDQTDRTVPPADLRGTEVEERPSPVPPAERAEPPAARASDQPPTERFRSLAQAVGAVIAPASLITGLALYFGWVITSSRALYLGLDPSVLELSTQDYLLRSADALFLPLLVLVLAGLIGLQGHALLRLWLQTKRQQKTLGWLGTMMPVIGVVLLLLGLWSMARPLPFGTPFLFPQLSLALGMVLLAYGLWLRRRLSTERADDVRYVRDWTSPVAGTLIVLYLVLIGFWAAAVYATALGRGRAQEFVENLDTRPGVVVYSKQDLHIDGPGIVTSRLEGVDSAYRFRYSGLRLLLRSGGRFFLLPAGWSASSGSVILLPEEGSLRFEFAPGGG